MKRILKGFVVCFSMYSIIPMPQLDWDENSLKYTFCFFPFVGVVIGLLTILWYHLSVLMGLNGLLYCAVAVLIPVVISGGIHVDGLIDTCDALFSYGNKEKKLEILKDPRVGAFGVIGCVAYFILALGLYAQFYKNHANLIILAIGFIITRCMSAFAITSMNSAKKTGLASTFGGSANKKAVKITLAVYLFLCFSVMLFLSQAVTLILAGVLIMVVFWFRHICKKQFGGITGDLAGLFLNISEIAILAVCSLCVWR